MDQHELSQDSPFQWPQSRIIFREARRFSFGEIWSLPAAEAETIRITPSICFIKAGQLDSWMVNKRLTHTIFDLRYLRFGDPASEKNTSG